MRKAERVAGDLWKRARDGQIFSVLFIKRTNGEPRKMVCRLGVKAEGSSEPRLWDPRDKDLLQVYDMQKNAFRFVSLENVVWLKADGDFLVYDLSKKGRDLLADVITSAYQPHG